MGAVRFVADIARQFRVSSMLAKDRSEEGEAGADGLCECGLCSAQCVPAHGQCRGYELCRVPLPMLPGL